MKNETMRYFLYARKSTDEADRQVLSIESQLAELREYAKKEGLPIAREFIESKTAKEPGREVFNEMMSLMEQGAAQGIVAWHPDRLCRNSNDGGRINLFSGHRQGYGVKVPYLLVRPHAAGQVHAVYRFRPVQVLRGQPFGKRKARYPAKAP